MAKAKPPLGIICLIVFDAVGGLALLLFAGLMLLPPPPDTEEHFGLQGVGPFVILAGLWAIYACYRMWDGKRVGFGGGQLLAFYLIVLPFGLFYLAAYAPPAPVSWVVQAEVFLAVLLGGGPAILWYLHRPVVKAYLKRNREPLT
ncbi:MAG TPA: hypothetical protein VKF15_08395 [Nitrososphaerales archaeon]|nr:hypothetical protein [Nitrososphaerales archaeon]